MCCGRRTTPKVQVSKIQTLKTKKAKIKATAKKVK